VFQNSQILILGEGGNHRPQKKILEARKRNNKKNTLLPIPESHTGNNGERQALYVSVYLLSYSTFTSLVAYIKERVFYTSRATMYLPSLTLSLSLSLSLSASAFN
jgi:hypothetical protein